MIKIERSADRGCVQAALRSSIIDKTEFTRQLNARFTGKLGQGCSECYPRGEHDDGGGDGDKFALHYEL